MFKCRKCNRSLQELQLWNKVKWYGDHYKCIDCNEDIKRDVSLARLNELANLIGGDLFKPSTVVGDFDDPRFDGWD